jgi:hypothetical protein
MFGDRNGAKKFAKIVNDDPESDNGYFRILNPDWWTFQ